MRKGLCVDGEEGDHGRNKERGEATQHRRLMLMGGTVEGDTREQWGEGEREGFLDQIINVHWII